MATSVAARNLMLDGLLQGATISISLHTADPGTSGGSEVSGGGYSRQYATFSAASGGQTSNVAQVVWTNMPACTVTHCGVWRQTTFLFGVPLTQARTVAAGDGFFFNAGSIVVQVT
ncbi:MAG: hypothetical protein N2045_14100 [Fimbriimonadales bacterium]|nr:hypothetical protein [Fimbriimonadales bacterium]